MARYFGLSSGGVGGPGGEAPRFMPDPEGVVLSTIVYLESELRRFNADSLVLAEGTDFSRIAVGHTMMVRDHNFNAVRDANDPQVKTITSVDEETRTVTVDSRFDSRLLNIPTDIAFIITPLFRDSGELMIEPELSGVQFNAFVSSRGSTIGSDKTTGLEEVAPNQRSEAGLSESICYVESQWDTNAPFWAIAPAVEGTTEFTIGTFGDFSNRNSYGYFYLRYNSETGGVKFAIEPTNRGSDANHHVWLTHFFYSS